MSSDDAKMVAKLRDGTFGLRLCVPGPGEAVTGAHPARSHHCNCALGPKTWDMNLSVAGEVTRRSRNKPLGVLTAAENSRWDSTPHFAQGTIHRQKIFYI